MINRLNHKQLGLSVASDHDGAISRRKLLHFLAASPLAATPMFASSITALMASLPSEALGQSYDAVRGARRALGADGIITTASDKRLRI